MILLHLSSQLSSFNNSSSYVQNALNLFIKEDWSGYNVPVSDCLFKVFSLSCEDNKGRGLNNVSDYLVIIIDIKQIAYK
jgi:hypothetical protein